VKLNPVLKDGKYAFVSVKGNIPEQAIAVFRETEGATIVLESKMAKSNGFVSEFDAAWIELSAETNLNDVGITAAVSKVLADNGISCNVFAPIHHDHIFVPYRDRENAIKLLSDL
jgi:hypothetical protein